MTPPPPRPAPDVKSMLEARSFAIIGASERSSFCTLLWRNMTAAGLQDHVYFVNRRSPEIYGIATHQTCAAIGEPIDLAFLMVPVAAVTEALRDAAAAGARCAVILSSGYAEAGEAGEALQEEMLDVAAEFGMTVLGPNCLGFANLVDNVPAIAMPDVPTQAGHVALISQSGASCLSMKDFAMISGIGLSHIITVGNESQVDVGSLIDHLVDDDRVHAIAAFIEGVRNPETFAAALDKARRAGKAVVMVKIGRSQLAAAAAKAHTGAVVGDDAVIDAVLDRYGVIRVDTIEDMMTTAGVAAHTGPLERPGVAVVSISGGVCDMVSDLAHLADVSLPPYADETVARMRAVLPAFGHLQNPLDVTGAAVTNPDLFRECIEAAGHDPSVGVVLMQSGLPWREDRDVFYGQAVLDAIGAGSRAIPVPAVFVAQTTQPVGGQHAQSFLEQAGIAHVVPGLRLAVEAMGRIADWSASRLLDDEDWQAPAVALRPLTVGAEVSEADARDVLADGGVPVVPARVLTTRAEAEEAAASAGADERHVLKLVSAQLAHKSDIGGVALDVATDALVATYDRLMALEGRPELGGARLDGVLLSPMRSGGTELMVGVRRDPQWGPVVAVGLGGVFVEILGDVALATAPVSPARADRMLRSLKAFPILDGARGRVRADLAAVAQAISDISVVAAELGPELDTLEVNPLRVDGDQVEALDALLVWAS